MKMVVLKADDIEAVEKSAERMLESDRAQKKNDGDNLDVSNEAYSLVFDQTKEVTVYEIDIRQSGKYAFFTEHMPFEFEVDEHFLKDSTGADIEPLAQVPEDGHHDHGHGEHDPHFWLDPVNAKAMVGEIQKQLSVVDPKNQSIYKSNAKKLNERLDALIGEIEGELEGIDRSRGFIAFHDAYQYFENRFGVQALGTVTVSPDVMPGAKRLAELREKVKGSSATCVFSEPQFEPKLINAITEGTSARTGVLDPLGAELKPGPDLYPALIRQMAKALKDCLS